MCYIKIKVAIKIEGEEVKINDSIYYDISINDIWIKIYLFKKLLLE